MRIADIRAGVHEMSVPVALPEKPGRRRFVFREVVTDDGNVGFGGSGGAHLAQAFNLPIANGGGWPRLEMRTMAGLLNGWRVAFHPDPTALDVRIGTDAPRPDAAEKTIPA